jgi:UDP-GlcNAc:undecaprenyl-phosphate/decaprenyl-phosphate GlcNAc-1-phosphate transferase
MIQTIQLSIAFFLSLFLVYITIPAIVRLSKAKKLFDVPNERKVNKTVIPNLGGVALFIGISISSLLSIHKLEFPDIRYIMVAMIIMFFVGIKDDILMITARKKFIAQVVSAGILVVFGDIRLSSLHGILGINEISYVTSFFVSMLAIVAIINSINLIDGIDGLASGLGILISAFFGSSFYLYGHYQYAILSFAVTGGLIPFFLFNVFGKENKIFMGDTGSLILGVLFAVIALKYNEFALTDPGEIYHYAPVLSLAIVSVPLFDMVRVFCLRIFKRKSPFSPDMNHIHHKLLELGYSHLRSTLIIVTSNLIIVALIYTFRALDAHILLVSLIGLEILVTMIPEYMLKYKAKKRAL